MHYIVEPGLYAVGEAVAESPVLVSANYKMSFDRLRSQLAGRAAWILVLDTRGINVWCAAGKGAFGTDELVSRVAAVGLSEVVSHRTLIVPQLGAPGVAAHEVRSRSGFRVVFGPVRAEDLPAFLDAGMQATPEMRRVRFPFRDRVVLIPMEAVLWFPCLLVAVLVFFLLGGFGADGYSTSRAVVVGWRSAWLLLGAFLMGVVATPALLPWVPGRAFATKGALLGGVLALAVAGYWRLHPDAFGSALAAMSWGLIVPAAASFLAMNFTGASTYTSLSGVRREMQVAVPLQALGGLVGFGLWLAARFV